MDVLAHCDDNAGRREATISAIRRDPEAAADHIMRLEDERDALADHPGAVEALRVIAAEIDPATKEPTPGALIAQGALDAIGGQ